MWDPGGRPSIRVPDSLYALIANARQIPLDTLLDTDANDPQIISRTELDSHANMPVVGSQVYVISHSGLRVEVSPFTPDYDPMEVEIVDAGVLYECPYTGKEAILVIRKASPLPCK